MIIRYVIDGPPGAGKTTLLFGKSDNHENPKRIIKPNLSGLSFKCVREPATFIYQELKKEKINPIDNFELFIEKVVEQERERYLKSNKQNEIYFFDRSFHNWTYFRDNSNTKLPEWYDSFNGQVRYSNPIFLLSPILNLDLISPKGEEIITQLTINERINSYNIIKDIYSKLGYDIVEIPMYNNGNIKENNKKRIECIMKEITTNNSNYIDPLSKEFSKEF